MNFNKVMLGGNLTRDIELRHTPSDTTVANFGMAVNEKFKGTDGSQKERTTFVDCEAWGRTAETMAQYLSKGRPVFIEGRLQFDQWDDRETGQKRSKLKIRVDSFQFVDSGKGGRQGGQQGGGSPSRGPIGDGPQVHMNADDIPF